MVLHKKGPTAAQAKSKQAILVAQRRGEDVDTSKKWAAGQNKQHSITKNTVKLDRETEELHHDRVTLEVGKVIQRGQQSKGLTQKSMKSRKSLQIMRVDGPFQITKFWRKLRKSWASSSGGRTSGSPSRKARGQNEHKASKQCIQAALLAGSLDHQLRRGCSHVASGKWGQACGPWTHTCCQKSKTFPSTAK
ncbi:Endothelial differentiation-related factor 1 [Sciurus carolinensis]|uniref:Endothelial differentiation-related factor 1 n=1 Tax=Sciurus carolinensis TaxID=30640 RepID=A0AA41MLZ0_SCICA|nr:Endothelial differentiation-related factor 1 [Sciurus carolinensis]